MPTYVCSAFTGRLTAEEKAEIADGIPKIHHAWFATLPERLKKKLRLLA